MMASTQWLRTDDTIDVKSYDDVQLVDLSDEDCRFYKLASIYTVLKYINRMFPRTLITAHTQIAA